MIRWSLVRSGVPEGPNPDTQQPHHQRSSTNADGSLRESVDTSATDENFLQPGYKNPSIVRLNSHSALILPLLLLAKRRSTLFGSTLPVSIFQPPTLLLPPSRHLSNMRPPSNTLWVPLAFCLIVRSVNGAPVPAEQRNPGWHLPSQYAPLPQHQQGDLDSYARSLLPNTEQGTSHQPPPGHNPHIFEAVAAEQRSSGLYPSHYVPHPKPQQGALTFYRNSLSDNLSGSYPSVLDVQGSLAHQHMPNPISAVHNVPNEQQGGSHTLTMFHGVSADHGPAYLITVDEPTISTAWKYAFIRACTNAFSRWGEGAGNIHVTNSVNEEAPVPNEFHVHTSDPHRRSRCPLNTPCTGKRQGELPVHKTPIGVTTWVISSQLQGVEPFTIEL
ncbi:hypothetical protein C8R42DRAFT_342605 [Lentinula raphanica]|nr:hypothetical protein C8R42DRAFT_342605 [Lentinula raphanica]